MQLQSGRLFVTCRFGASPIALIRNRRQPSEKGLAHTCTMDNLCVVKSFWDEGIFNTKYDSPGEESDLQIHSS